MTIQIIHNDELAEVLEVNGQHKLDLKLDTSGNVQLSKSAAGLKADVTIPETDLSPVTGRLDTLEAAKTQHAEKIAALESRQDIKLTGAEVTEENNLKLTLEGGAVVETSLAKFVDAPKSAADYWTEIKALPSFGQDIHDAIIELVKASVKEALKGDEVQNLAGETKGYLISAN